MAKQQVFWPPWWGRDPQQMDDPAFAHIVNWIITKALEGGARLKAVLQDPDIDPGPQGPVAAGKELKFTGINLVTGKPAAVVMGAYSVRRLPDVALTHLEYEFGFGDPMDWQPYTPPPPPPKRPKPPTDMSGFSPIGQPTSGAPNTFHRRPGAPIPSTGRWEEDGKIYRWVEFPSPFGSTGWWELENPT